MPSGMKLSGIKLNVFKANMQRWFYRGAWTVVFGLLAVAVVAGALTLFVVMLVVGSIGLLAVSLGAWLTRSWALVGVKSPSRRTETCSGPTGRCSSRYAGQALQPLRLTRCRIRRPSC